MFREKIIDCKSIAQKIKDEVKEKVKELDSPCKLTVFTNPDDEASKVYIRNKRKAAESCGIEFEEIELKTMQDTGKVFEISNKNPFIVQMPMNRNIRGDRDFEQLLETTKLDADGFGKNSIVKPATPKGIMKILEEIKFDLEGKHIVVIGRSIIVGKPIAKMCLDKNATVTVCHSKTKDLEKISKEADLLIVAIGKAKFINERFVKEGAVVIDVGINRDENGKLCGDVDLEFVLPIVSKITPVPGGVGLLTTACLMENVVEIYEEKERYI